MSRPGTLGELKASAWVSRPVKEEVRQNALVRIAEGRQLKPRIGYVFDARTGTQIAQLLPQGGPWGDYFGIAVAIDGTTVIVGATGSAYVFDAMSGLQHAVLREPGGTEDVASMIMMLRFMKGSSPLWTEAK